MTGYANRQAKIPLLGEASLELRSTNHKFLEIVFHLPEGFLSLEEKIKKEIETKIKRGRIICALNIAGGESAEVFINHALLKKYISSIKGIERQFGLQDEISINTLLHLPGILFPGKACAIYVYLAKVKDTIMAGDGGFDKEAPEGGRGYSGGICQEGR